MRVRHVSSQECKRDEYSLDEEDGGQVVECRVATSFKLVAEEVGGQKDGVGKEGEELDDKVGEHIAKALQTERW